MSNRIPEYKPEQLDINLQLALLALLAYSTKRGTEVAIQVPPELYDNGVHREIAKAVIAYRLKYQKAPRAKQMSILTEHLPVPKDQLKVARLIVAKMENNLKGMNQDYVVDQASEFARRQFYRKTALAAATEAAKRNGDNEAVRKMMYDAMMYNPMGLDKGIQLSDTERGLAWLDEDTLVYPINIEPFDNIGVGLVPKGMTLYLAGKGTGKSWSCVHVGRQMLKQNRRVLHVTLEMSDVKVAKRYHQAFNAMSRNYDRYTRAVIKRDKRGNFERWETRLSKPMLAQTSSRVRRVLERKIETWKTQFDGLYIKEFPSGSLTMPGFIHYLDHLAAVDGFEPDVVILDYPDLFKINPANQRLELGAIFVELRGLASSRGYAMFCPSQVNRKGMDAEEVRSIHTSEAMLKVNTSDTVLTYSQTKMEFDSGLARLFANHVRDSESGMEVVLTQAYQVGQYAIDAIKANEDYRDSVKPPDEDKGKATEAKAEKGEDTRDPFAK